MTAGIVGGDMLIPGAWIETLESPQLYTHAQISLVVYVAFQLDRGKFVLCEAPKR